MKCVEYSNLNVGKTISGVVKKLCKKEDELMQPYGLTHFHSKYIMNIYKHNSITMTDLTALAGADKANTTRVVKDLLSENVVEKSGGERKFFLSLTEKGREIAKNFKQHIENFMKTVFKDFQDHEIKSLVQLLEKLFLGVKTAVEG